MQRRSQFALEQYGLREARQIARSRDLLHIPGHDLRLHIDTTVIQSSSVHLFIGVLVLRVENNDDSAVQNVFLIAALQLLPCSIKPMT